MAPYFYNVIYNRPEGIDTEDSRLALNFVEYLVSKIAGWGHEGYFADRDAIPGKNIFDELFRIVSETEKTIVVITPEFRSNYWAKYSKQAAFKYLMDEKHQDKMIPIAVNIDDNQSLRELNVNEPLHIKGLTEDDWEGNPLNSRGLGRLKKAFDPRNQQKVVEEIGDNRLRTEGQQQLVTRPASETSMFSVATNNAEIGDNRLRTEGQQQLVTRPASEISMFSVATNNADELQINNDSKSESHQWDVIYDRSMPEPRIHSVELQPHLDYDWDTSSVDTEVLSEVTSDRLPIEDGPTTRRTEMYTLVSLSDDKNLSMDLMRSVSESQGTDRAVQQNSFEPRPETLSAEGMTGTRPDIAKLSLGSFEEDNDSEVSDQSQTLQKCVLQPESGYTTLSDDTPSSCAELDLLNQTDDAKSSDQLHCSDTSHVERSDKSTGSVLEENGTKISSSIGMFCLTVTKCVLNIDKAYQS